MTFEHLSTPGNYETGYKTRYEEPKVRKLLPCARCGKMFKLNKVYAMFCSDFCENHVKEVLEKIEYEKYNISCGRCGVKFHRGSCGKSTLCSGCAQQAKYNSLQSLREMNRKKREDEPKTKRKGKSLDELIKISEHKRVWQDSGWSHYLKGRKWDRI